MSAFKYSLRNFLGVIIDGANTGLLDLSLCPDSTLSVIISKTINASNIGIFITAELPLLDNSIVAVFEPNIIDDNNRYIIQDGDGNNPELPLTLADYPVDLDAVPDPEAVLDTCPCIVNYPVLIEEEEEENTTTENPNTEMLSLVVPELDLIVHSLDIIAPELEIILSENFFTAANRDLDLEVREHMTLIPKNNNLLNISSNISIYPFSLANTVKQKKEMKYDEIQSTIMMPETTMPETTMPETTMPETTMPETTIPETTIPETTMPETTMPETTMPEITMPEITIPETILSKTIITNSEYIKRAFTVAPTMRIGSGKYTAAANVQIKDGQTYGLGRASSVKIVVNTENVYIGGFAIYAKRKILLSDYIKVYSDKYRALTKIQASADLIASTVDKEIKSKGIIISSDGTFTVDILYDWNNIDSTFLTEQIKDGSPYSDGIAIGAKVNSKNPFFFKQYNTRRTKWDINIPSIADADIKLYSRVDDITTYITIFKPPKDKDKLDIKRTSLYDLGLDVLLSFIRLSSTTFILGESDKIYPIAGLTLDPSGAFVYPVSERNKPIKFKIASKNI